MPIIQQMSIDATLLFNRMEKAEIGEVITYEEMSQIIARDIQKNRSVLSTAMNHLIKQSKVFCCVPKTGYQRITDKQKVEVAEEKYKGIRRITKRCLKVLGAVDDFSSLPNETKIKHNATASMCGAIQQFTSTSAIKKLEVELVNNNRILPVAETLKQFS